VPECEIVFITDPIELIVTSLFIDIPNDIGLTGMIGKKYEAIKDFLRWKGLSVSYWTPIVHKMGIAWASEVSK